MDIKKAIKDLRSELCMTQTELANALHINFTTVSRWENGKSTPNHSVAVSLISFAKEKHVSAKCQKNLKISLLEVKKANLRAANDRVMPKNSLPGDMASFEAGETYELQKRLVDSLPGGVVIYKIGQEIQTLYYSEGILKLSGHEKKEYEQLVKNDPIAGIVYEDDQPELRRKVEAAIHMGGSISMTYRIKHKSGALIWVQLSATMMDEQSDGVIFYTIITRPTEEAEIYRNITKHSSTAIFIAERSTRKLIFANEAWKKLRNIPVEQEVVGCRLYDLIPQEDMLFTDEELEQLPSDRFLEIHSESSRGQYLDVQGRAIDWSGYDAYVCYITDETEIQNNHAMLKAAMDSAKVLAWRYDYRTNTVTDSGSLGLSVGLPKVIENVPESLIDHGYVHKDSIEDFRNLFRRMKSGEQVSCNIRSAFWIYGRETWQRQIYTPIFDQNGNYIESIGTSIDVTEQKEREQNYKEQIRLRRLLATNALGICHYNLSQNQIISYESEEKNIIEILQAESADEVLSHIYHNASSKLEQQEFESAKDSKTLMESYRSGQTHFAIRHHMKNDDRWVETSFDLITNPYSGDVEAIGVLRDISEMVKAENIVNVLMKIDYESITTINAQTGEAHPFTDGHLDDVISEQKRIGDNMAGVEVYLRKNCDDIDVERIIMETSLPYVKEQLEQQMIHTVAYTLRQGRQRIHKRVIYTYLDDTQKEILCAMQDLTETYRQEEQQKKRLAAALRDAELANHAKTDFFSRMSHDMRTPMNGILGLAQLSADENDVDTLKRNIAKIEESGKYLLSLINDTLDLQKIESGRMKLDSQIVAIQPLVENIIDIIKPAAKTKNIEFQVINQGVDLEWYIRVDPVRVKQIFINLLSNAIKFTPEGGRIQLEFYCLAKKGFIRHDKICVRDNGIGISEEFMKDGLFSPFSQESNDASGRYAGSGLGLSIVHSLVEMMGGRIEVESEQGKGSLFSVYLDFERVPENEVEQSHHRNEKSELSDSLEHKKILLVEDHPLNAEIMKRILEKAKCEVVWADDGQKGVTAFKEASEKEFDAILMDIRMPVMNGLEATKAIRSLERKDAKRIPIIAMTANAYEEDVKQVLEAGMNCHLAKPIEVKKLYETLHRYIGK